MTEPPFLKRKIFDPRDMTYRFEDGSAPIPYEFRVETNLMITHQETTDTPMLMQWLGKLWGLKDFLKKQDPNWMYPPISHK